MYNLIHGNALQELQKLKEQGHEYDMVLTDPPYSSGGRTFTERRQDPITKYAVEVHRKETTESQADVTFTGDNLDQRAWTKFTAEWLTLAREVTKPSGLLLSFIDWRQLPAMTDAVQMAGWIWRGVAVWDKGNARPINDGIAQQAEFIVWASNGKMLKKTKDSTYSWGVIASARVHASKRLHMTEKPLELMRELARVARPNSSILDPFMGSGSTIHAAELEGMDATGIELTDHYYDTAVERMATYERNKPIGTIGE